MYVCMYVCMHVCMYVKPTCTARSLSFLSRTFVPMSTIARPRPTPRTRPSLRLLSGTAVRRRHGRMASRPSCRCAKVLPDPEHTALDQLGRRWFRKRQGSSRMSSSPPFDSRVLAARILLVSAICLHLLQVSKWWTSKLMTSWTLLLGNGNDQVPCAQITRRGGVYLPGWACCFQSSRPKAPCAMSARISLFCLVKPVHHITGIMCYAVAKDVH
jgi:hypothetical protein